MKRTALVFCQKYVNSNSSIKRIEREFSFLFFSDPQKMNAICYKTVIYLVMNDGATAWHRDRQNAKPYWASASPRKAAQSTSWNETFGSSQFCFTLFSLPSKRIPLTNFSWKGRFAKFGKNVDQLLTVLNSTSNDAFLLMQTLSQGKGHLLLLLPPGLLLLKTLSQIFHLASSALLWKGWAIKSS